MLQPPTLQYWYTHSSRNWLEPPVSEEANLHVCMRTCSSLCRQLFRVLSSRYSSLRRGCPLFLTADLIVLIGIGVCMVRMFLASFTSLILSYFPGEVEEAQFPLPPLLV